MSYNKSQRWNTDNLWGNDFNNQAQEQESARLTQELTTSREQDNFLQICHNKPFWLWGQKGHETKRYCPNCGTEYDETVSECKCTLLGYFKDYQGKDFPIYVATKWNPELIFEQRDCCFNHIIGLPAKPRVNYDTNERYLDICPIFNWQKDYFFDPFETHDDLLYIKAGGIAATETKLRHVAWKASTTYKYDTAQVPIVVGPKEYLAIQIIGRFKDLFPFDMHTDMKTAFINGCNIHTFASDNIGSLRSLKNPVEIIIDEFDFFRTGELPNVLHTIFRYIAKSAAVVRAISTPNEPGGFCDTLEKDPGKFRVIKMHYSIALGTIYSIREIEEQKKAEGFDREYGLQYLGGAGNFFDRFLVDACVCAEDHYNPEVPFREAITIMADDTGWSVNGNRNYFARVIASWVNYKVYFMYVKQFKNPDVQAMLKEDTELRMKYYVDKIMIDGSDTEYIYQLKKELREFPWDYHQVDKENYKHMIVEPSTFTKMQYDFLVHDKKMVEDKAIVIHPSQQDLIIAFKACYVEDKKFVKEKSTNNDIMDATSMILKKFYDMRVNRL